MQCRALLLTKPLCDEWLRDKKIISKKKCKRHWIREDYYYEGSLGEMLIYLFELVVFKLSYICFWYFAMKSLTRMRCLN